MKRRLLALLAFAGALAFACGPRPRSGSAAAALTTKTPLQTISFSRHSDPARSAVKSTNISIIREAVKLDARFDVLVDSRNVRLTLEVKNVGKKHAELSFANGQAYDFVVLDSTGVEVWRWATGHIFTQTVRNKALAKGSAMFIEEKWAPPTMSGRYTAIATLKSSNYPVEQRVEFVIPNAVNVATAR
jgi:hypothetical protein